MLYIWLKFYVFHKRFYNNSEFPKNFPKILSFSDLK